MDAVLYLYQYLPLAADVFNETSYQLITVFLLNLMLCLTMTCNCVDYGPPDDSFIHFSGLRS